MLRSIRYMKGFLSRCLVFFFSFFFSAAPGSPASSNQVIVGKIAPCQSPSSSTTQAERLTGLPHTMHGPFFAILASGLLLIAGLWPAAAAPPGPLKPCRCVRPAVRREWYVIDLLDGGLCLLSSCPLFCAPVLQHNIRSDMSSLTLTSG